MNEEQQFQLAVERIYDELMGVLSQTTLYDVTLEQYANRDMSKREEYLVVAAYLYGLGKYSFMTIKDEGEQNDKSS